MRAKWLRNLAFTAIICRVGDYGKSDNNGQGRIQRTETRRRAMQRFGLFNLHLSIINLMVAIIESLVLRKESRRDIICLRRDS